MYSGNDSICLHNSGPMYSGIDNNATTTQSIPLCYTFICVSFIWYAKLMWYGIFYVCFARFYDFLGITLQ